MYCTDVEVGLLGFEITQLYTSVSLDSIRCCWIR